MGTYIGDHLEGHMGLNDPWQRHRTTRVAVGFKDWGRTAFRVGSYGLSAAVSVLSFAETMPQGTPRATPAAWIWRMVLFLFLAAAWGLLVYAEFSTRATVRRASSGQEDKRATQA